MVEPERMIPRVIELIQHVQEPRVFLRMAVLELRRIADEAPEIASELRLIAQQLEAEADDLVCRGETESNALHR